MPALLVATKLNLPVLRPRVVPRRRLRDLLERGLEGKLTLISAPAGFGKTTLLADWLAQPGHEAVSIAWLSLDDSDNEPSIFWPHLVAAVRAGYATKGRAFPDVPAAMQPDQAFIAILINQLAAAGARLAIVLDDLHLVDRKDIHELLAFFVEHLPPAVHVVISTRADPALPLARMRVRGDLVEIRSTDLRFSADEAAAYLNDVMHLGLSPADAQRLERKTEGWIAALQLAVLSLEGREDAAAFIDDFAGSGRYVVDYLVEEVLARLPDDLRDFLMTTSALRRMSAPLCDAVTGAPGSGQMLDRLERQNLFLVPLDAHRQWFRYHHLFADVLRGHLLESQAQTMPEVHRRASQWFEAHGERAEAIHHALEAKDFEWAADLIERAIPEIRRHRREPMFRAWMKPIPDAVVRKRPVLGIAHAGVLVSLGVFDGIEDRLRAAEAEVVELADPRPLLAHVELYRTALAQVRGDVEAAAGHARQVLELAPLTDHLARAGASGFLGIVSWTRGELEEAATFWTICRDGLRGQGHLADVQGTTIALADIRNTQGRLTEALRLCDTALTVATNNGVPVARGIADTHASLAFLHLQRNELAMAREHLDRCQDLGEVWGLAQYPYRSRVARALLGVAEGRAADAIEHLQEAERRYISDFFPNVRPVPALIANVQIRMWRLDEAEQWARAAAIAPDNPLSYLREFEHTTLARLLLARGDAASVGEALGLVERLADAAAKGERQRSLVDIHLLAALAHKAQRDDAAALGSLRRAIALAEPERICRPFIDDAEALGGLVAQLSKRESSSAFVRSIMLAGQGVPERATRDHPELIEPLSDREIDVLRLLRTDLSGPEIAEELSVSLNTLRTHTRNIFEKLGVNSRRAAVRRADELNLFASATRA